MFTFCVRAGIYLTVIMAMSALSVALSVFVLNCHHRGAMLHRPPRLVRLLARGAARVMCMSLRYLRKGGAPYCRGPSFPSSCSSHSHSHGHGHGHGYPTSAAPTASRVDSGLHEMGCVAEEHASGGVHSQQPQYSRQGHVTDLGLNGLIGDSVVWTRSSADMGQTSASNLHSNNLGYFGDGWRGSNTGGGGGGGGGGVGAGGGGIGREVATAKIEREILHYLRAVLEAHERSKAERIAVNEWQEVARVLDTLFFWLFVFITAISTLVLLVFSPMTKDVSVPQTPQQT